MHNNLTKEDLVKFNKDAEVLIDEFSSKIQKLYERIIKLDKKNLDTIGSYAEELNKELKHSILVRDEEMSNYINGEDITVDHEA